MSRQLPSNFETETEATVIHPTYLVELAFTSGTVRLWTGNGDLSWDSKTWTGVGTLLDLSNIEETIQLRATGMTVSLSGISSSVLSLVLSENVRNRVCRIWLSLQAGPARSASDPEPLRIFTGRMDTMTIDEQSETCTVSINVENRLIDFERPREKFHTEQDQRAIDPTDASHEYVADIASKATGFKWG